MSQRLYVGGLPYKTTDEELKNHFSQAGTVVAANVITDRETGRSRGFGFVEMSTEDEGQKAIEMFDGKDFDGRQLVVNVARPQTPRAGRFA
jgi:RNA recognition motif-containing protein